MPWFCAGPAKKSSKKSKKSKRKPGRKEIERCQKFVVIVQDYVAATMDEVSVHRGQVVEMVCTKGNWVYIRGNNSSTGYVPKDYTLEVDNNNSGNINIANGITSTGLLLDNGNIAGPAPSTRSINVGTLQHSGSSVTSVEVHQVSSSDAAVTMTMESRDSAEGQQAKSLNSELERQGTSQAIYEIPRCPDGAAATEARANSDEGSGNTAPALPPRSTCLPSAAEIQHSLTSYRSASNTPYHHRSPSQRHRPGNLTLANNSTGQPCPYHRPRYPYGPFPPNTSDTSPAQCTCHAPSASTHHHRNPATTPQVPAGSSMNGPHPQAQCTTPGYSPSSVWTPSRRGSAGLRESPLSQHRNIPRHQQAVTTPGVPQTPGSASLPSATPASPVISNFALTPPRTHDSRDFTESLPTMGNGIRVSSSSNSSYSSYGQRAMARPQRSRRYSSDFQIHSTISENLDVSRQSRETPTGGYKNYGRRQSQPCLMANSTQAIQTGAERENKNGYTTPHQQRLMLRPSKLPVRRSLSMQEPFSLRQPLGGRNSCPCTPQQLVQQQQNEVDNIDGQMKRAVSCTETAQGANANNFHPAATPATVPLRSSAEVATTPQRTYPATSAAVKMRRRRSRSSSNRLDSVPSIEEEGVEPLANNSNPDDVFLPESRKKPVGIFRCCKACTPKFKGEIALQENELVIVLDSGVGQWAWVMTTSNLEGLVSKSVLVRYQPNGLVTTQSPTTTTTSDGAAFDDCDSGRGTITKRKGPMNLGVDACTQTEPVTNSAPATMPRSVSVGPSTGYSTSSGLPTNESSPLSTSERAATVQVRAKKKKKRISGEQREATKDENIVLLEAAATAVAKHAKSQRKPLSQPPPQEWFNTIDSLDDRERIKPYVDSRAGSRLPSSSQLLESSLSAPAAVIEQTSSTTEVESLSETDGIAKGKESSGVVNKAGTKDVVAEDKRSSSGNSPKNKVSKRRGSAAVLAKSAPSNSAISTTRSAAVPAEQGGRSATGHVVQRNKQVVKPGTIHYHDRISGMGSVNFNSNSESEGLTDSPPKLNRQQSRPQIGLSNVLTAVKNYTPAPNSKNCISIKEGDVLHLQTHMHYPKGWMWVWHTSRRSFGYVPKNYVAYTYDTVRRGRPRINTVEDEV